MGTGIAIILWPIDDPCSSAVLREASPVPVSARLGSRDSRSIRVCKGVGGPVHIWERERDRREGRREIKDTDRQGGEKKRQEGGKKDRTRDRFRIHLIWRGTLTQRDGPSLQLSGPRPNSGENTVGVAEQPCRAPHMIRSAFKLRVSRASRASGRASSPAPACPHFPPHPEARPPPLPGARASSMDGHLRQRCASDGPQLLLAPPRLLRGRAARRHVANCTAPRASIRPAGLRDLSIGHLRGLIFRLPHWWKEVFSPASHAHLNCQ